MAQTTLQNIGLGIGAAVAAVGIMITTAPAPEAKAGSIYWNNGGYNRGGVYVRRGYYGPRYYNNGGYYYGPAYRRGGAAFGPNGACAAGPFRAGCVRY